MGIKKDLFSDKDVSENMIDHTDKYIRKTIINAKNSYYQNIYKLHKKGIVILDIDDYKDSLGYTDIDFEKADGNSFIVEGYEINISELQLFDALSSITEKQREVLFMNVIFGVPLSKIAATYGISIRATEKHKQKALENVRRKLNHYEKQK